MIALRLLAFFFTLGAAELNTARDEQGAIRRGVIHLPNVCQFAAVCMCNKR